jgi:HTH-type transcriptional regulator / antitoxin HipB
MNKITTFEQLLEKEYGNKGTPTREKFEADAMAFRLGVLLKEARKEAHLTQEELAEKSGTKKVIFPESNPAKVKFNSLLFIGFSKLD